MTTMEPIYPTRGRNFINSECTNIDDVKAK